MFYFSLGQEIYALSDCQNNISHVEGKIYAMSEKICYDGNGYA